MIWGLLGSGRASRGSKLKRPQASRRHHHVKIDINLSLTSVIFPPDQKEITNFTMPALMFHYSLILAGPQGYRHILQDQTRMF